jgi:dTDP-4-dehydrorhamnose 3,5-epimerase
MGVALQFEELALPGAKLVHGEPVGDPRGYFERIFCADTFERHEIIGAFPQISISSNRVAGIRRGLHFQREPFAEAKLIRCITGKAFDVIVDIRKDSPTFGKCFSTNLSAGEHVSLYVPKGFAHGFQTLADDTSLLYCISTRYNPAAASGLFSDDPSLEIDWPARPSIISAGDMQWPLLAGLR